MKSSYILDSKGYAVFRKILNVGCGDDKYGTDFVDMYPQRKEVKKCDIENERLPYDNNVFDEVYSENFFEHLKNPSNALKEMKRVLKHGGKLVVITDNAGFWGFHVAGATTHYGGYEKNNKNFFGKMDRHFGLFTPWHLTNYFEDIGLKKVSYEYLLVKVKNPFWYVRLISNMISIVTKRIGKSQIRIEGVK